MFLENGFQAYLSKPMDMQEVNKVMDAWVRDKEKEAKIASEDDDQGKASAPKGAATDSPKKGPAGPSADPSPTAARPEPFAPSPGVTLFPAPKAGDSGNAHEEAPIPDIPGVDVARGIERFGGDQEIFLETLRSFATNTDSLLRQVTSPKESDLKPYMIVVHGIKSSSYGICAPEAGKLAERLEKAAKESDFAFISMNNQRFIEIVTKLTADIRKAVATKDQELSGSKAVMERPDPALIDSLLKACDSYDMDGIDTAIAELDKHSYQSDPNLVQWIRERAETMEFDRISEKFLNG
jgi:HPt (histidine-containing phosphotransfer) domain-containing protein